MAAPFGDDVFGVRDLKDPFLVLFNPHLSSFRRHGDVRISEAQWTSVGIAVLIVAAEISGLWPLRVWNLIAGVCVVVLLPTVATVRATNRYVVARVLAKLICRLRGFSRPAKVDTGEHAIYHLIFQRGEFRPF